MNGVEGWSVHVCGRAEGGGGVIGSMVYGRGQQVCNVMVDMQGDGCGQLHGKFEMEFVVKPIVHFKHVYHDASV
jgi:hypothetical protein